MKSFLLHIFLQMHSSPAAAEATILSLRQSPQPYKICQFILGLRTMNELNASVFLCYSNLDLFYQEKKFPVVNRKIFQYLAGLCMLLGILLWNCRTWFISFLCIFLYFFLLNLMKSYNPNLYAQ